jgi:hypothetical protein
MPPFTADSLAVIQNKNQAASRCSEFKNRALVEGSWKFDDYEYYADLFQLCEDEVDDEDLCIECGRYYLAEEEDTVCGICGNPWDEHDDHEACSGCGRPYAEPGDDGLFSRVV